MAQLRQHSHGESSFHCRAGSRYRVPSGALTRESSAPPTPTHKHFVPQSRSAMSDTRCTPLLAVESAGSRESVCMSRSSGREVGTRCSGAGSLTMAGAVLHQRSWVGACAKSSLCPWDEMFVCREALFRASGREAGTRCWSGVTDDGWRRAAPESWSVRVRIRPLPVGRNVRVCRGGPLPCVRLRQHPTTRGNLASATSRVGSEAPG